jgi:hypothetical protein
MASKILVPQTLQNGFWPSSRFNPAIEDEFMDDGTIGEEHAEDAPFVKQRCNRPTPSFRVGCDVFAGYFLAAICVRSRLLGQSPTRTWTLVT